MSKQRSGATWVRRTGMTFAFALVASPASPARAHEGGADDPHAGLGRDLRALIDRVEQAGDDVGVEAGPSADDAHATSAACTVDDRASQRVFDVTGDAPRLDIVVAEIRSECPADSLRLTMEFVGSADMWALGEAAFFLDLDSRTRTGCDGADRVVAVAAPADGAYGVVVETPTCDDTTWTVLDVFEHGWLAPARIDVILTRWAPDDAFSWSAQAWATDGSFDAAAPWWCTFDGFESPRSRRDPGPPPDGTGYWMLGEGGRVHAFGAAPYYGEPRTLTQLGGPATDLDPMPGGQGYRTVDADGRVSTFLAGVTGGTTTAPGWLPPGEAATTIAHTPSGDGFWVFTSQGRAFAFGDAQRFGDLSGVRLNGPITESVPTPTGRGYYMIGLDGGIFAFGDAVFHGSMGDVPLNGRVVGMAPDPDGAGYWLVAEDGGIFAFDAPFRGSMGDRPLSEPVVGMVAFGSGYLMVGLDGGIFNFSDLPFHGSLGADPPSYRIVTVAPFVAP